MPTRTNSHGNPERRRESATLRQAGYDALTVEQKLAQLPKDGAKRQRTRLELAKQKPVVVKALPKEEGEIFDMERKSSRKQKKGEARR